MPGPSALAKVDALPGLPGDRIPRLHAVAEAALDGRLEAARLQRLGPEAAREGVQRLPGIGPFYSALITMRGTGFDDILPVEERRSRTAVHQLYGLEDEMSDAEYEQFAERWRPVRSWAVVLIRAASNRVLGDLPSS